MKRIFFFAAAMALSLGAAQAQQLDKLPVDSNVIVGHLDNGLTYYIRHNELPKQRAEFHIAQAVGAILEEDHQNGLAHFLEHMAFNGTEHFHGKGIINYFESIGVNFGGNINAYTALDETVYRLSEVPTTRTGIIDSALLVMHDWSHSLLLEGDEIDAERGVIREEWRTRASAERRMWSKLNPLIYPGSQYAKRDVIGDTAVINNFSYDALRDYYHKWYGPDLQAIVVVGDIDPAYIEAKIKELWADVPARANRGERPVYGIDDNKEPIVAVVTDPEGQYTRIRMDWKKNPLPDELRGTNVDYMQDVLNGLLVGMMDMRFAELAQDPDAAFVGGGCAYTNLVKSKDAFLGIVVSKHGQEKAALQTLMTQMEKMHRYGFTQAELERAKTNMLTSYEKSYNERASRRNIQFTREYIRNFLDGEPIPGIEWEYAFVKQVMPVIGVEMMNRLAAEYITDENLIISLQAPEKEGVVLPTETEIRQMLADVKKAEIEAPAEEELDLTLVKKAPKAGKIKKVTKNEALGTTEWMLKNGVRIILKPTEFKQDEILMSAFSEGGTSMIADPEDLPSAVYASAIVEYSGIGEMNLIQLQKALTGKHASVSPSVNTYSETMDGQSTVRDLETMLQLTWLYFTQPRLDEQSFLTLKSMLQTQLKNKASNHKAVFRDSVSLMASNYSPRTLIWNEQLLEKVDAQKAFKIYKERFANPADFTFTFTGNINPDDPETQQLICTWLGGLKTKNCKRAKEHFVDRGVRPPKGVAKNWFVRDMQIRQTTNRIQFWAPMDYSLAGELNMEVISRVLDMRYLESVREREGGSYGVGTAGYLNRRPVGTAILLIQFDTDPEKETRLMEVIYEEINKIAAEGPLAEDLKKAKESMLKDLEEDKEKNGWWDGTVLPEWYRYGINYLTDYEAAVRGITAETVQQTLRELLEAGNSFEVVMEPVMNRQ
ncbi:MAG: insulinase family protein [Paludibacteraceae bacterium]|nr:insulinase family protein [Paludibacteraceae bacterium]